MNGRMFRLALAVVISSSVYGYTDSLWIVGGEGYPGELATVEVWLQYEGGGGGDSMSAFDIPLTWDASICTVEAITIGLEFEWWTNKSRIDNDGTKWPPAVPKIGLSVFTFYIFGPPVHRGAHLAGTVDFRILDSAPPSDSACLDTLMEGFSQPWIHLGFVDWYGETTYIPSFSTGCVRVVEYYCGDCNADRRITSADIVYMGNYIYRHGPDPVGEADVNLDRRITVADAIYLGNYIYRRGPEPCNPPQ